MHQLGSVRLPPELDSQYEVRESEHWLTDLARLNVFIGQNNHGKSRLLRELFCFVGSTHKILPPTDAIDAIQNVVLAAHRDLSGGQPWPSTNSSSLRGLKSAWEKMLNRIDSMQHLEGLSTACHSQLDPLFQSIDNLKNLQKGQRINVHGSSLQRALENSLKRLIEFQSELNPYRRLFPASYNFQSVYIPALRGLRGLDGNRDVYRDRTHLDYFESNEHIGNEAVVKWSGRSTLIYTGLDMYQEIRRDLLGNLKQREAVRGFEEFIGHRFFDGSQVTIIPSEGTSHVLTLKLGNEQEKPLHELGDGLQQILIQTYPIFKYRDKDLLLFVEEPELYLHPGLERVLIDTFLNAETDKSRQIFVATHSSQFLDITLDTSRVSVFKCKKKPSNGPGEEVEPKFTVEQSSNRDFQLLRDLGIRNSSVLLSNCTIWVEGITDRQYIRHFLEVVQSEKRDKEGNEISPFLEDVHFSFVEYGGANMTHWSFLGDEEAIDVERLCGIPFVIADADARKDKKHAILEQNLGERYHKLKCREIENLIEPSVLKELVGRRDPSYANDIDKPTRSAYRTARLGSFIEDKMLGPKRPPRRSYKSKTGSIAQKAKFADECIALTKSTSDMSQAAIDLTEEIIEFVRKKNSPAEST